MTSPTVFIVDDESAVRESLRWLIEAVSLPVRTFESAESFLSSLDPRAHGVVLLDIRMPGMSGLDLLDRFVPHPVALPVIVLTAHADVEMAVQAMRAGAFDMLEKPFKSDVLVDRVRRALAMDAARLPDRLEALDLRAALETLTPRERDVLFELQTGQTNKEVGATLEISPRTVEIHRARILQKTATDSVTELVRRLVRHGLAPTRGATGESNAAV